MKTFLPLPIRKILLLLFISLTSVFYLSAEGETKKRVISSLFRNGVDSVTYTEEFVSAVPKTQLNEIIDSITAQVGSFIETEGRENPFTVVFERGEVVTYIHLDGMGRISGLRFTSIGPRSITLTEALKEVRNFDGEVSYAIEKNDTMLEVYNPDTPMAVGSSFKLAVLAALDEEIDQGAIDWQDTYIIRDSIKSLPSGILQNWPSGSPLTLHTLATLMISISDNTATDALISLLGREKIQKFSQHTQHFLTTKEFFILKNPDNSKLREEFIEKASSGRIPNSLWERIHQAPLPSPDLFTGGPISLEIEWFFSTRELCSLIKRVAHLDLTTVNPGVAIPSSWKRISYKGGSEPGVLNLTTHVITEGGDTYTVSVTWNRKDRKIDEQALYQTYRGILKALKQDS